MTYSLTSHLELKEKDFDKETVELIVNKLMDEKDYQRGTAIIDLLSMLGIPDTPECRKVAVNAWAIGEVFGRRVEKNEMVNVMLDHILPEDEEDEDDQ